MLKNENGQTTHHVICTDIVDRVSGIRMNSLRPAKEKKRRNHKSFLRFSYLCVCVCLCVSIAFVLNFSLCCTLYSVHCTLRAEWNWREKMFLAFRHARSSLCLGRDVRQFSSKWLWRASGQRASLCQYHMHWYFDNGRIYVIDNFDIYAFCLHDSKPTATSWPTTTLSNERSGTVQLAMTVTETAGISVHFFHFYF